MKRHPSLRDLSEDHHHGLVHASHLLQASSAEASDAARFPKQEVARDFLEFFAGHTNAHFREEEEVLLPTYARYSEMSDPVIAQMMIEHVQIRRLVLDLQQEMASGSPSAETMRALGTLLRAHIRLEENIIFPLIERSMSEEALQKLAGELAGSNT